MIVHLLFVTCFVEFIKFFLQFRNNFSGSFFFFLVTKPWINGMSCLAAMLKKEKLNQE